jgi:parvulin-like peptidyl-prolyl isomerase
MTSDADSLVAATVNGIVITRESYEAKLAQAKIHFLKAPGIDVATKEGEKALRHLEDQVLDWMIDQVLIEEAASAQGITIADAQLDAEIARMRGQDAARFEKWLAANGLTTDSIRQQVRIDLITAAVRDSVTTSLPREEMQVHVRHILLSDESVAKSVLQKLRDGQDFAAIAREFSEDETTRATGGDIGFVPRGLMPPDFEKASFALRPGEISDVIRTQFGYHIVQVVEIDPKRPVPDEFWPIVQERAFESWLAARRAKAKIRRVR